MDVQNIGFNAMAENTAIKTKDLQGSDFKQILDKVTGGETAQEIRRKYDVTLCVKVREISGSCLIPVISDVRIVLSYRPKHCTGWKKIPR